MELVPLRVKTYIGAGAPDAQGRVSNEIQYPDFDSIPSDLRGGVTWCSFIDRFGSHLYDNCCDFHEADDYNPVHGMRYSCFLVPASFADAAVARFPDRVEILSEEEFEHFHDARVTVNSPEEIIHTETLNAIRAKHGIPTGPLKPTAAMSVTEKNAIDPNSTTPGIVRNQRKYWKDVSAKRKVTIRAKPAK